MDLYFDCFSGISGDMILGAFLDLGISSLWLKKKLLSLSLGDFDISMEKKTVEGIKATNCLVSYSENTTRKYIDIVDDIKKSDLSNNAKQKSLKVFGIVARAESKIHGCNLNELHFHEIGAVDSIIDIVGTIICIEHLNVENIFSSELPLGNGFAKCSHGILPIPAPATLEILKGIPVYGTQINHELVTPTGAGIVKSMAQSFGKMPNMVLERIGYGCGKIKHIHHPNLLRIILGKTKKPINYRKSDFVTIVETNIDDMNPEIYSFLIEKLFISGALDVCFIPVIMKKSRPGIKLEVTCPEHLRSKIINDLLSETTTLGVRYYSAKRNTLPRKIKKIKTELGIIPVKISVQHDGNKLYKPEYEVCKKIALEKNIPIRKVYDIISKTICYI